MGHGVDFREGCEKLCWLRPCRGSCVGITGRCSLVPLDVTSLVSISSGPGHPYLRNRNAYAESSSKQASPQPDFSNHGGGGRARSLYATPPSPLPPPPPPIPLPQVLKDSAAGLATNKCL